MGIFLICKSSGNQNVGQVLLHNTFRLNFGNFFRCYFSCSFNFGSSHAIHHFVVKEPFYIRQLTVPFAHRVMREMGVRFNDFGTFARANRWRAQEKPTSATTQQVA